MSSAKQATGRFAHRLILIGIAVYTLAFAFSYMSDPMALAPQLDAKENLALASQFDSGTVAEEPFYRAVFYPWLLSLVATDDTRALAALLMGLLCHFGNAVLVCFIAGRIWQRPIAGPVAASLYLLNPASLFFSLQVLDMTMAITLFLAALLLATVRDERRSTAIVSGLLLGLCVLTRPHFLPVAVLVPAAAMVLSKWNIRLASLGWLALVALLLGQGAVNYGRSGEFRVLPWQGSYNLYAANREGANGLYYKQTVDVSGLAYTNPARAESEHLYRQATGATPPLDIGELNAFWRRQTIETVLGDPAGWLQLMAFKAYAVLNSAEPYNNVTFSYHKARFPLLRFNPMNWGILLILGALGGLLLYRNDRQKAMVVTVLILGYTISLLLYYASARFRLPLVPLMAVLGSGVAACPRGLFSSKLTPVLAVALSLAAGVLTFSNIGNIHSEDTYVQDRLLLANANAELGRDVEAARLANEVLWEQPDRAEALRIYTVSYFNLHLMQDPSARLFGDWAAQGQWIIQSPPTDPVQDVILGVFYWQWGNGDKAVAIWKAILAHGGPGARLADACLAASGTTPLKDPQAAALQEAVARVLATANDRTEIQ